MPRTPAPPRASRASFVAAFAVATLVFSGGPVSALTYVPVPDATLVDQARIIATLELSAGAVSRASGSFTTDYEAVVLDVLKGAVSGSRLLIRVPGGLDGGDADRAPRGVRIFGTPSFSAGDRVLAFLRPNGDGTFRILHISQGAFREVRSGGKDYLLRNLTETWELTAGKDGVALRRGEDRARDSASFKEWVRDRAAGVRRPADYFAGAPAAVVEKFTLLPGPNVAFRWFRFDRGKTVKWRRHRDGQAGLGGAEKAQFRKARKAWSRAVKEIRLANGGTNGRTAGFTLPDGRNTLLFEDFNEAIGDDFDCEEGGVIAIGGFSDWALTPQNFKSLVVFEALEAEIVMNDGVECLFDGQPDAAGQVYTHELGHTLGLGHACGDSTSPKCSKSELLSEAVMKASLGEVFGARLNSDDVAGARMLYDPDFFAAQCENAVPGGRRFCRRCGPCGEGQGHCRRDSDCFDDLVCAKDVGEDFGFDPSTNVCVPPD